MSNANDLAPQTKVFNPTYSEFLLDLGVVADPEGARPTLSNDHRAPHSAPAREQLEMENRMAIRKSMLAAVAALALASPAMAGDIVDTAVKAGQFSTLAAALKAAGLVDTLKGPGPFTVFAPTDDAFKKLPPGTVENLLKPENKAQLVNILTYHVVSGKVMSASLAGKKTEAKTVQGGTLSIDARNAGVMVGNAKVLFADVAADNGVIHAIDTVVLPN